MVCGIAVLVGFFLWERRLSRRPGGQPLLDLVLFRARSYTWGVILAAVAIFAMFGVLCTMPQYFQGVLGTVTFLPRVNAVKAVEPPLVEKQPAVVAVT
jgi:amino acid transporter